MVDLMMINLYNSILPPASLSIINITHLPVFLRFCINLFANVDLTRGRMSSNDTNWSSAFSVMRAFGEVLPLGNIPGLIDPSPSNRMAAIGVSFSLVVLLGLTAPVEPS